MSISIIIRAHNPQSCADFIDALGLGLQAPDAMHFGAWQADVAVRVMVVAGDHAPPSLTFGTPHRDAIVRRMIERGGIMQDAAPASDRTAPAQVVGPNGERLTIEQHDPSPYRPAFDQAEFSMISLWLEANRTALRQAVALAGGSNPRILGPGATGDGPRHEFALVLDGDGDTDVSAVDHFLGPARRGPVGIVCRLSSTLPADRLRELDAVSFPV